MKVLACPRCGETMPYRSRQCMGCGWAKADSGITPTNAAGCMVLMMMLLIVSSSCSVLAYTGRNGDEQGFGFWGLVQSGIIIATMVGLGISLSKGNSPFRRGSLFRGIAGVTLAGVAIVATLYTMDGTRPGAPDQATILLMVLSSAGLLISSFCAMRSR